MNMDIVIKTTLIDYLGELNGGVSISIGLTVADDFTFESIYWIHPDGHYLLETEDDFLKLFGAKESTDLPFLKELISDIDFILPSKYDIFKQFLNI